MKYMLMFVGTEADWERFSPEDKKKAYDEIAGVNAAAWQKEVASHDELLGKLGAHLPRELEQLRAQLHHRLAA